MHDQFRYNDDDNIDDNDDDGDNILDSDEEDSDL